MPSLDVIVIGGGIAGVSLAAELSALCRVALLEHGEHLGQQATGRSAAYFAPAYGNRVVRLLTQQSEAYFRDDRHEVALINERAALFVGTATQQGSIDAMQAEQPNLQRLSFPQAKSLVSKFRPDGVTTGLLDVTGGDLDVDAIMQSFLQPLRQNGGLIHTSTEVQKLRFQDGLWQASTGSAEFSAPIIVNAAGAWADQIAGLAQLPPLGLAPKRRTALLVDGSDEMNDWPLVVDIDEQFYFKPDAGKLLLSPADETPCKACDAHPQELDIAIAVDRVQQVADISVTRVNHSWAGLRTFAPDNTFVIGFDPRAPGFFWCAGQGGYGVQSAPAVARLAKSLCLAENLDPTMTELAEAVSPQRLINS